MSISFSLFAIIASQRNDLLLKSKRFTRRYAPINVNPVEGGGEGVRARGGDLTNFNIF